MQEFPILVQKGNATVKIYRTANRGKDLYTLAYLSAGGRKRENFRDLGEAKRKAASVAASLNTGDHLALQLTGADRQMYVSATQALKGTGIPLDVAAREYAAAVAMIGAGHLLDAVRHYRKSIQQGLPDKTVKETADAFHAAKKEEGMSDLYLKDIRIMLQSRLAGAFQCDIKAVTAEDLQGYMSRLKVGPVAKNNHRRLIVALFNFAKARGWLNKSESTAADAIGAVKIKTEEVVIYTPEEMKALLSKAPENFLPWLALIGFGGVRREELAKGLAWEHIDFKQRSITVPANIAKTGKKRKIQMQRNLLLRLLPYREKTGPIFTIDPRKYTAAVSEAAKVPWKRNALRHSFGSYRMEQTKNAGLVALEMGNSASIVMKHYHEVVTAEAASAYWKYG